MRWRQRASEPPARGIEKVAASLLTIALLVGCGIAKDPLAVALGDGSSATASAAFALEHHSSGRLTGPTARTMLDDARRELSTAMEQVSALSASGDRADVQADALPLLARAVHDLHTAADRIGSAEADAAAARLRDDATALERLEKQAASLR